jgi:hypothetical protein
MNKIQSYKEFINEGNLFSKDPRRNPNDRSKFNAEDIVEYATNQI